MGSLSVRRLLRALWVLLALATFAALPWLFDLLKDAAWSLHDQAWVIAGVFVILAVSASVYEVAMHLEHYNRPRLQVRVVRVLLMVPIYALDAWLGLRFTLARVYLDPLRECYEAFVIYNFYAYLIAYLEDEFGDLDAYYAQKARVEHIAPVDACLESWPSGAIFFEHTRRGVLAYVLARPLCTLVANVTTALGVYGDGSLRYDRAYPYVALVGSIAQTWALYCLILMYQATKDELAPLRPLLKFICIKAVVFFSYWQSVTLSLLALAGWFRKIPAFHDYTDNDVAAALQNFLICLEMFVAALAHAVAFPPRDYVDPERAHDGDSHRGFFRNVAVMWDVRDVLGDVHELVADVGGEVRDSAAEAALRGVRAAARVTPRPHHWVARRLRRAGSGSSTGSSEAGAASGDDSDGGSDRSDADIPARDGVGDDRARRGSGAPRGDPPPSRESRPEPVRGRSRPRGYEPLPSAPDAGGERRDGPPVASSSASGDKSRKRSGRVRRAAEERGGPVSSGAEPSSPIAWTNSFRAGDGAGGVAKGKGKGKGGGGKGGDGVPAGGRPTEPPASARAPAGASAGGRAPPGELPSWDGPRGVPRPARPLPSPSSRILSPTEGGASLLFGAEDDHAAALFGVRPSRRAREGQADHERGSSRLPGSHVMSYDPSIEHVSYGDTPIDNISYGEP